MSRDPHSTVAPLAAGLLMASGSAQSSFDDRCIPAVALLGNPGGSLDDQAARIPLPITLLTAASTLRAAGQGHFVDAFETTVNQAAEGAIPQTLEIVGQTVSDMSVQDVRGIPAGDADVAIRFLRAHAGESPHATILPLISEATDAAGATAGHETLIRQAVGLLVGLPFGGLVDTGSVDLDQYVAAKTTDRLFVKLAAEEKAMRQDALARKTDLLELFCYLKQILVVVERMWAKTPNYRGVHCDATEAVEVRLGAAGLGIPYPQRDVHIYERKAA
jgi:hypothetical protein